MRGTQIPDSHNWLIKKSVTMEAAVEEKEHGLRGSHNREVVLGTVGIAATPKVFGQTAIPAVVLGTVGIAVASAIALGVFHLIQANGEAALPEQDPTAYLLSGSNREALLAALKRRKQGRYVAYNPLDA